MSKRKKSVDELTADAKRKRIERETATKISAGSEKKSTAASSIAHFFAPKPAADADAADVDADVPMAVPAEVKSAQQCDSH